MPSGTSPAPELTAQVNALLDTISDRVDDNPELKDVREQPHHVLHAMCHSIVMFR